MYQSLKKKTVSAQQVESKWKSLKRTYKSILFLNKRTDKHRRRWEFYDAIQNSMHQRPEIQPTAICSSN
jgi:hypothetical protein